MRMAIWVMGAAAALAALAAAATTARAPAYAASAAADAKPLSPAQRLERRFLQISAANMRFQAEGARIALARSNNPAVKELANSLLARQQTTQPELLRLLHARGMAMPLATNEHAKLLKQLAKLNGAKFDRLYVDEVVIKSYQVDIANYERVALQAEDRVLKAWVERQLPLLRLHFAKAGKALPNAALKPQRAV
jgi:putative membrane protein